MWGFIKNQGISFWDREHDKYLSRKIIILSVNLWQNILKHKNPSPYKYRKKKNRKYLMFLTEHRDGKNSTYFICYSHTWISWKRRKCESKMLKIVNHCMF